MCTFFYVEKTLNNVRGYNFIHLEPILTRLATRPTPNELRYEHTPNNILKRDSSGEYPNITSKQKASRALGNSLGCAHIDIRKLRKS